jgi:hypothetical protein
MMAHRKPWCGAGLNRFPAPPRLLVSAAFKLRESFFSSCRQSSLSFISVARPWIALIWADWQSVVLRRALNHDENPRQRKLWNRFLACQRTAFSTVKMALPNFFSFWRMHLPFAIPLKVLGGRGGVSAARRSLIASSLKSDEDLSLSTSSSRRMKPGCGRDCLVPLCWLSPFSCHSRTFYLHNLSLLRGETRKNLAINQFHVPCFVGVCLHNHVIPQSLWPYEPLTHSYFHTWRHN